MHIFDCPCDEGAFLEESRTDAQKWCKENGLVCTEHSVKMFHALQHAVAKDWARVTRDEVSVLKDLITLWAADGAGAGLSSCAKGEACSAPVTPPHLHRYPKSTKEVFHFKDAELQRVWGYVPDRAHKDTEELFAVTMGTAWHGMSLGYTALVITGGISTHFSLGIPAATRVLTFTDEPMTSTLHAGDTSMVVAPLQGIWERKEAMTQIFRSAQAMRDVMALLPGKANIFDYRVWDSMYKGALSVESPLWDKHLHETYLDWVVNLGTLRYTLLFCFDDDGVKTFQRLPVADREAVQSKGGAKLRDKTVVLDPVVQESMRLRAGLMRHTRGILKVHQRMDQGQSVMQEDVKNMHMTTHLWPSADSKLRLKNGTRMGLVVDAPSAVAWTDVISELFSEEGSKVLDRMFLLLPGTALCDGQWVQTMSTVQNLMDSGSEWLRGNIYEVPVTVRSDMDMEQVRAPALFTETMLPRSTERMRLQFKGGLNSTGSSLQWISNFDEWVRTVHGMVVAQCCYDVALAAMSPVEWWMGGSQAMCDLLAGEKGEERIRGLAQCAAKHGTLLRHDHDGSTEPPSLAEPVPKSTAAQRDVVENELDSAWLGGEHVTVHSPSIRPAYLRHVAVPAIFPVAPNMAVVGARYDAMTGIGWSLVPPSMASYPTNNNVFPRALLDEWTAHFVCTAIDPASIVAHTLQDRRMKTANMEGFRSMVGNPPAYHNRHWTRLWFHMVWKVLRMGAREGVKVPTPLDMALLVLRVGGAHTELTTALVTFMRPALCRVFSTIENVFTIWGGAPAKQILRQFVTVYCTNCPVKGCNCSVALPFKSGCRMERCILNAHGALAHIHKRVRPLARALLFALFPVLDIVEMHYSEREHRSYHAERTLLREVEAREHELERKRQAKKEERRRRVEEQKKAEAAKRREKDRQEAEAREAQNNRKRELAIKNRLLQKERKREAEERRRMRWEEAQGRVAQKKKKRAQKLCAAVRVGQRGVLREALKKLEEARDQERKKKARLVAAWKRMQQKSMRKNLRWMTSTFSPPPLPDTPAPPAWMAISGGPSVWDLPPEVRVASMCLPHSTVDAIVDICQKEPQQAQRSTCLKLCIGELDRKYM